jgi:hypothetical protein
MRRLASALLLRPRSGRPRQRANSRPSAASARSSTTSSDASPSSIERFQITHYQKKLLILLVHDTHTNLQWIVQCADPSDLAHYVLELHAGTNDRIPDFLVSGLSHSAGD